MTRNELKKLIKECLVELLRDGIGSTLSIEESVAPLRQQAAPQRRQQVQEVRSAPQKRSLSSIAFGNNSNPALDEPAFPQQQQRRAPPPQVQTGNPILDSMLMETAQSMDAMNEEYIGDSGMSGDVKKQERIEHFRGDPLKMFDGNADAWAKMAFDGPKRPGMP